MMYNYRLVVVLDEGVDVYYVPTLKLQHLGTGGNWNNLRADTLVHVNTRANLLKTSNVSGCLKSSGRRRKVGEKTVGMSSTSNSLPGGRAVVRFVLYRATGPD